MTTSEDPVIGHDPDMDSPGRLASNGGILVAGRLLVAALGWIGTVLVAKELGTEGFGQFTLVFSILGMLSVVTDLGVGRVAVAALLDGEADRKTFAGTYVLLRVLLGFVGYGLAVAVIVVANYPSVVVTATIVGGLVVVLATPAHAYDVAFQVRNRLAPLAVITVISQLAQLALTIALVIRGGTLVWFVVPAVLNPFIVLIWKVPAAHRIMEFRYRVDLGIWRELLREAIPLSAGTAFVTLYYRIDSVMLSKLDTFESVGAYGVAYKFVDLVHFVPIAAGTALIAPLTATWTSAPERFHLQVASSLRFLALAAGTVLVGFWLFSTETVVLMYGEAYRSAGRATAILVTGECLAYASTVAITALIATNRHRRYPIITITGLILNVVLNFVLIPRFSFDGAAVTTLITEAVVLALLWNRLIAVPGAGTGRYLTGLRWLPVAVAAAVAVGWLATMQLHWIVAALLAMATYAAATMGLGILPHSTFTGLLLRRRRP